MTDSSEVASSERTDSPTTVAPVAPVDVVIVSYNSASTLARCVAAARSWAHAGRVIVVDNGSSDESVAIARSVADEVHRSPTNRGFGAGQNLGVSQSGADWVLVLNPDAEVDADGLELGYAYVREHGNVGMAEGSIRTLADGSPERWCGSEPGVVALTARFLRLRERLGEDRLKRLARLAGRGDYAVREVDAPSAVEFLAAVAPLVRRQAFEEVGGFDEEIFLYAEDIDLCRRLRGAGWSLVALPFGWARHVGGASSVGDERRRADVWWRSHRTFVQKHWRGPRRWLGLVITSAGCRFQGQAPGS